MDNRIVSFFGIFAMLFICWLCSKNRRLIAWRVVIVGTVLQFLIGFFVLETDIGLQIFTGIGNFIAKLLDFSTEGARFLFGNLVSDQNIGAIFAFRVLPTIIFVSSLMAILYHLKIMQAVVSFMARIMTWSMKVSGAEFLLVRRKPPWLYVHILRR